MHDMRAFDGLLGAAIDTQFNLDFPSTAFTSSEMATDLFPEFNLHEAILASSELNIAQTEPLHGAATPVLDATWQSFVEQLGF